MRLTGWHARRFWVPPAHCSTDRAGFVYIVSPGGKPASFKTTIRLKEPLRGGKEGRRRLTSGRSPLAGPGPADRRSGSTKNRRRCLRSALLPPQLPWPYYRERPGDSEEGGEAGAWRPRSGGGWLPAQARASAVGTRSRTRDSSAAPPSFLPPPLHRPLGRASGR